MERVVGGIFIEARMPPSCSHSCRQFLTIIQTLVHTESENAPLLRWRRLRHVTDGVLNSIDGVLNSTDGVLNSIDGVLNSIDGDRSSDPRGQISGRSDLE